MTRPSRSAFQYRYCFRYIYRSDFVLHPLTYPELPGLLLRLSLRRHPHPPPIRILQCRSTHLLPLNVQLRPLPTLLKRLLSRLRPPTTHRAPSLQRPRSLRPLVPLRLHQSHTYPSKQQLSRLLLYQCCHEPVLPYRRLYLLSAAGD